MYLASFDGPEGAAIQGLARLTDTPAEARWQKAFARRAAALDSVGEMGSALRIVARPDPGVVRTISVCARAAEEPLVRRYLAGIAWLDNDDTETVELPTARDEFDAWSDGLPQRRLHVKPVALEAKGCFLAGDFRVAPLLSDLVAQAAALGFVIGYQANFIPFRPAAEALREAGRNAVRLRQVPGMPEELAKLQEGVVERFRSGALRIEEILAVENDEAEAWLLRFFANAVSQYATRHRFGEPPCELASLANPSDAALLMHTGLLYGNTAPVALACSEADSGSLRRSLFEWRPPDIGKRPRGAPPALPGHAPQMPSAPSEDLPAPTTRPNHVFVSYKRDDMPLIGPALASLDRSGLPIWYDRGIPGGEEWDAVLENKIETAGAVLAFLSQAAVESKYCRRELKYADAVDKPIVAVLLGGVTMRHGLAFMLQQLQAIPFDDRERDHRLLDAVMRALRR